MFNAQSSQPVPIILICRHIVFTGILLKSQTNTCKRATQPQCKALAVHLPAFC